MDWPSASVFDMASASSSALEFRDVVAFGATGATYAAAPESARAATIFCLRRGFQR